MATRSPVGPMKLLPKEVEYDPLRGSTISWVISGCEEGWLETWTEWSRVDTVAGRQEEARHIIERLAAGHGGSVTWADAQEDTDAAHP